jgi:hypothetical protein
VIGAARDIPLQYVVSNGAEIAVPRYALLCDRDVHREDRRRLIVMTSTLAIERYTLEELLHIVEVSI